MQDRLLTPEGKERVFVLVLETGDEVMSALQSFVRRENLSAARLSGIGAFSDVVLAYFDWEQKNYVHNEVGEQVEVASLNGDVVLDPDRSPTVHAHVVVGRRDGTALAGHLMSAHVRPTLEIILTESPAHLHKRLDPESGLPLIHIDFREVPLCRSKGHRLMACWMSGNPSRSIDRSAPACAAGQATVI